jgi:hypothetical protein
MNPLGRPAACCQTATAGRIRNFGYMPLWRSPRLARDLDGVHKDITHQRCGGQPVPDLQLEGIEYD